MNSSRLDDGRAVLDRTRSVDGSGASSGAHATTASITEAAQHGVPRRGNRGSLADAAGARLEPATAGHAAPVSCGRRTGWSPSRRRRPRGSPGRCSGAIDSTVSLSNRWSSAIGSVLVTITSRDPAVLQPVDRRAGQDGVRGGDDDVGGAVVEQRLGGLHDRAAGVDHVVDEHADAALDLTDDPVGTLTSLAHVGVAASCG